MKFYYRKYKKNADSDSDCHTNSVSTKGRVKKIQIFLMAFAIKRRTPPPLNGTNSHPFFTPLFSFEIESLLYETDFILGLTVKNITFKSTYNWFKIDIHWLLRPPTAIFSHVHNHHNYYIHNIKLKLCAKRVLAVRE